MPRWATTTDRASFNTDEITMLLLMCHEKVEEGSPNDEPGLAHRTFWAHIGAQIESLRYYHVCCACLAFVHEMDRERHPCEPCTCEQPVVASIGPPAHHAEEASRNAPAAVALQAADTLRAALEACTLSERSKILALVADELATLGAETWNAFYARYAHR